jgi:hypothetical protein
MIQAGFTAIRHVPLARSTTKALFSMIDYVPPLKAAFLGR